VCDGSTVSPKSFLRQLHCNGIDSVEVCVGFVFVEGTGSEAAAYVGARLVHTFFLVTVYVFVYPR
jgi:hypothetical protein